VRVRYSRAVTDLNDWRVTVSLAEPAHAGRVRRAISEREAERDVRRRLGRAVAVGGNGSDVFLYAGTEVAAREAERVAREVLAEHGIPAGFTIERWHPAEEKWEDVNVALPGTEAERQAEHQRLEDEETAQSQATGIAQWQVQVECRSRHEAVTLAGKLRGEGHPVVRRWKFLVLGANNSDEAEALAGQIRREAIPGITVRAVPSGARLPFIPF
jgi:hypothetical protein